MRPICLLRIVSTAVFAVAIGVAPCVQAGDKETALYNFNETSGGYAPSGVLVMDSSGNLYGAAYEGDYIRSAAAQFLNCRRRQAADGPTPCCTTFWAGLTQARSGHWQWTTWATSMA